MKICPNCQKTFEDSNFCTNCGVALVEMQDSVAEAPAEVFAEAPVEVPAYAQPAYQQPVQPQYQPVYQPVAVDTPSLGKKITGLALACTGLFFFLISFFSTISAIDYLNMSYRYLDDAIGAAVSALVFSMFALPLSIVGLVLSKSCGELGGGLSKAGKICGLIGTIASGVFLFVSFILLVSASA